MIALVQRVTEARAEVGGETIGSIGRGILALVGVERGDAEAQAERLAERVLGYRIFPDAAGKMNLSLLDITRRGQVLVRPFCFLCKPKAVAGKERNVRCRYEGQSRQRRARDLLAAGFSRATVLKFAGATISISSRSFEWLISRCRIPGGW